MHRLNLREQTGSSLGILWLAEISKSRDFLCQKAFNPREDLPSCKWLWAQESLSVAEHNPQSDWDWAVTEIPEHALTMLLFHYYCWWVLTLKNGRIIFFEQIVRGGTWESAWTYAYPKQTIFRGFINLKLLDQFITAEGCLCSTQMSLTQLLLLLPFACHISAYIKPLRYPPKWSYPAFSPYFFTEAPYFLYQNKKNIGRTISLSSQVLKTSIAEGFTASLGNTFLEIIFFSLIPNKNFPSCSFWPLSCGTVWHYWEELGSIIHINTKLLVTALTLPLVPSYQLE